MAEALGKYYEREAAGGSAVCPDEPDFDKLYEALGDRTRQNAIRAANPGPHCDLLVISPTACDGCTKNPRRAGAGELGKADAELAEWAFYLADLAAMGMLPPIDKIPPATLHAARLAFTLRTKWDRLQAARLAAPGRVT